MGGRSYGVNLRFIMDFVAPHLVEEMDNDESGKITLSALKSILFDAELDFVPESTALGFGIDLLVEVLGINAAEREVLEFFILCKYSRMLNDALELTPQNLDMASACSILSVILNRPLQAIENALSSDGILINAGLLESDGHPVSLERKFNVPGQLVDKLSVAHSSSLDVLDTFLNRAPESVLVREDFAEHADSFDLVSEYLSAAVRDGLSGVNILLYGAPGVGKTQIVRCICNTLRIDLFEVPDQDKEGGVYAPAERLSAYLFSQKLLENKSDTAILFDEMEDVFPQPDFFDSMRPRRMRTKGRKSWINRLLETNKRPAFWVGNNIDHLDLAYLRRFDLVLEIPKPSQSMRKRILNKFLAEKGIETNGWIGRVPDSPHLTPGLIEKSVRVIQAINPGEAGAAQLYKRLTGNVLKAMGYQAPTVPDKESVISYDPEVINIDVDPTTLTRGISDMQDARILFYGAPGTGKTELARHLAKSLEKPLIVRKPSDLLDKFLGGTEKNLAAVFEEAEQEGAVLLLDEVDSFLMTRAAAHRSWEITQVNELLVQIEAFKGVLIACTNAMSLLDEAAMRRFDVKVRFECMSASQVRKLFCQVLNQLGSEACETNSLIERRLGRLDSLTPGDFHAVIRRLRITGLELSPQSLCAALEQESSKKAENKGRGIGFSAHL